MVSGISPGGLLSIGTGGSMGAGLSVAHADDALLEAAGLVGEPGAVDELPVADGDEPVQVTRTRPANKARENACNWLVRLISLPLFCRYPASKISKVSPPRPKGRPWQRNLHTWPDQSSSVPTHGSEMFTPLSSTDDGADGADPHRHVEGEEIHPIGDPQIP